MLDGGDAGHGLPTCLANLRVWAATAPYGAPMVEMAGVYSVRPVDGEEASVVAQL